MQQIDNLYASLALIEILCEEGYINEATYKAVKEKYKPKPEKAA